MSWLTLLQMTSYFLILFLLVKPLGSYIACIFEGRRCGLNTFGKPMEKWIYRLCGIAINHEMNWKMYLLAMLHFNLIGLVLIYLLQRLQGILPLNPQSFPGVAPDLSFNTAASFITNTNWQAYGGEATLSYLTQMLALTTHNFLSAATGLALLIALIRGLSRKETNNLGNFWVDVVRGTLYILLPLSFVLALVLASQGVIQNFKPYHAVNLIQPFKSESLTTDSTSATPTSTTITTQLLPMGPVASQIAIKQLGTNGGGYFNTNSAHPFENPTPLSNFLEMLAILVLPMSLCYTFGVMVNDRRQGWAIFAAMSIMLIPLTVLEVKAEHRSNPAFNTLGVTQAGNIEGKETRFSITESAMWSSVTTATANGSVNSMLDAYSPAGGLLDLWLMHLGEVVFGGVGSGLYSMLLLVIITVFIVGLMVGRTPEYLGKKIEPYEMKMASFGVLIMPITVLLLTAIAVCTPMGLQSLGNPGPHGFTEILYAFTSMVNNNGSAFAGLNANTPFYNIAGGLGILIGRYWVAIPTLAIAGSLASKKILPTSVGTLPTHTPLFIFMLILVAIILGALSFFPTLALGPIAEELARWRLYGG